MACLSSDQWVTNWIKILYWKYHSSWCINCTKKLNVDTFFQPIINELANLELGIDITIENIEKKNKFFLIAGVFDKPKTKASILNMNQCTKCEQSGHLLNDSDEYEDVYIYKFNQNDAQLRTDQKYDQD